MRGDPGTSLRGLEWYVRVWQYIWVPVMPTVSVVIQNDSECPGDRQHDHSGDIEKNLFFVDLGSNP